MEISHVLPENERNKFPNPRDQLHHGIQMIESACEGLKSCVDRNLGRYAILVFGVLRRLKSKMTVKTLISIIMRDTKEAHELFCRLWPGSRESADRHYEKYLTATIQFLANDGFIKLGNAAQFEAREIVKYHATAEPEFRSGKFQL